MGFQAINFVDLAVAFAALYSSWRIHEYSMARKRFGKIDLVQPFQNLTLPGLFLADGLRFGWRNRNPNLYSQKGKEVIVVSPWLWGSTWLYSNSTEVMKQVVGGGNNQTWIKPYWASGGILMWGPNVASENLESWRRHRRVMGPAFNPQTYELVWRESVRLYEEMIEGDKWPVNAGEVYDVPVMQHATTQFALCVIGSCAFGLPFTWENANAGESDAMSVQEGMHWVSEWTSVVANTPRWFYDYIPSKKLRTIGKAFRDLEAYLKRQIEERKRETKAILENSSDLDQIAKDVFSRLVLANEQNQEEMSDLELRGNAFITLLAGHETSSSTLAAVLALLAVHPKEQAEVYEHICEVFAEAGDIAETPLTDKLYKVRGVFLESLRLYPAGYVMIRESTEDTTLTFWDARRGTVRVPVPKGTGLVVDVVGTEHNPRIYDDPLTFRPSRWDNVNDESISAFSVGPRTCLGKKFAITESVAFLALLLRDFEVQPLLQPQETIEEWKRRVLDEASIGITLGISKAPLRFVRR